MNIEMKHTPGPWHVVEDDDGRIRVCDGTTLYGMQGRITADVLLLADAKLIAAAPDLLAACHMARRACEAEGSGYEQDPLWCMLSNAIVKAEGK